MRHKFVVLTVTNWLQSVYIYGGYCKIKTGLPSFGPLDVLSQKNDSWQVFHRIFFASFILK